MQKNQETAHHWRDECVTEFIDRLGNMPYPASLTRVCRAAASAALLTTSWKGIVPVSVEITSPSGKVLDSVRVFSRNLSPDELVGSPKLPSDFCPETMSVAISLRFRFFSTAHNAILTLSMAALSGCAGRHSKLALSQLPEIEIGEVGTTDSVFDRSTLPLFPLEDVEDFIGNNPPETLLDDFFVGEMQRIADKDGIIPQLWFFAADSVNESIYPRAYIHSSFRKLVYDRCQSKEERDLLVRLLGPEEGASQYRTGLSHEEMKSFWHDVLRAGVDMTIPNITDPRYAEFFNLEYALLPVDSKCFCLNKHDTVMLIPYVIEDLVVTLLWTYMPHDIHERGPRLHYSKSLVTELGERIARKLIEYRISSVTRDVMTAAGFDEAVRDDPILGRLTTSKHFVPIQAFQSARRDLEAHDTAISLCASAIPHHIKGLYQDTARAASKIRGGAMRRVTDKQFQAELFAICDRLNETATSVQKANELLLSFRRRHTLADRVNLQDALSKAKQHIDDSWEDATRIKWDVDACDLPDVAFHDLALNLVVIEVLRNALQHSKPVDDVKDVELGVEVTESVVEINVFSRHGEYTKVDLALKQSIIGEFYGLGLPTTIALLNLAKARLVAVEGMWTEEGMTDGVTLKIICKRYVA